MKNMAPSIKPLLFFSWPVLLAAAIAGCAAPSAQYASSAATPAVAQGRDDATASIRVAAVVARDIDLQTLLSRLFQGTNLRLRLDPGTAGVRVTISHGPDTLERILADLAEKNGLIVERAGTEIHVTPKIAGYDPDPCTTRDKFNAATGHAQIYGIPLDIHNKPIPGRSCEPAATAPITIKTEYIQDAAMLPASYIEEIPQATFRGKTIQAGEPRYRLALWTFVSRAAAPLPDAAYYQGCTRYTPIAVQEKWHKPNGDQATRTGAVIDVETSHECPDTAIVKTVSDTRSRESANIACRGGALLVDEHSTVEQRQIAITETGARRPGPWKRVSSINPRPIQTKSPPVSCDPQVFARLGERN